MSEEIHSWVLRACRPVSNVKGSRLEVGAVRAGDKLAVLALKTSSNDIGPLTA